MRLKPGYKVVILLLGSNLGDRKENLIKAKALIETEAGDSYCETTSPVFESEPWGYPNQGWFYNCALKLYTREEPLSLLKRILEIERSMGRVRNEKWGERIIDIDIIYFEDVIMNTPELALPHPEFEKRGFAIIPVLSIFEEFVHPVTKHTIHEILKNCMDKLVVRQVAKLTTGLVMD